MISRTRHSLMEQDIVVVFTGHVPDGSVYPADYLVTRFILPAVGIESTEPNQNNQWQLPLEATFLLGGIGVGVVALLTMQYLHKRKERQTFQ